MLVSIMGVHGKPASEIIIERVLEIVSVYLWRRGSRKKVCLRVLVIRCSFLLLNQGFPASLEYDFFPLVVLSCTV